MTIRKFRENDFNRIAEIYSHSKLDELRFEREQFELLPLEEDESRLQKLLESIIVVYDHGGIVVGYGAVFRNEIRALFVHPLYRGKGIGKALLDCLLKETVSPAMLYVAKSNFPAKSIYHKYGFKVTREFETSYNGKLVLANEMIRSFGSKRI